MKQMVSGTIGICESSSTHCMSHILQEVSVDRFLDWFPFNKTTHKDSISVRLNSKCHY